MKISTYKAVCYEGANEYGSSPCYRTLEEAVKFMWENPWGDCFITWDNKYIPSNISSYEELLNAVKNDRFSSLSEDDRKMFVIEHHEIELEITQDMVGT